jgi:2-polyprenyl-3-methyl-5-hydroxy-6-metoxy-1,4-benzoquinol methylase
MSLKSYLKKSLKEIDGIYQFELKDLVVKTVSKFYTSNPFPNYKENDDKASINQRGENNLLASQFKKFAGYNKKILEVGCGTGQLSAYFSNGNNNLIVAMDATLESLKVAENFSKKNNIKNIGFVNADIFEDVLQDEYFDFIWCNGVLHHTKNPYEAFKIVARSLKKRGYILIGLYNKFGRIRTLIRRLLYKIFGTKILKIMDPTLRKLKISKEEQNAWIQDQYEHPQESLHTIDEVMIWFEKNNIDFISSIPNCDFNDHGYDDIFREKKAGNYIERFLNQIFMIFGKLGSDGGLFVMVGKKKDV